MQHSDCSNQLGSCACQRSNILHFNLCEKPALGDGHSLESPYCLHDKHEVGSVNIGGSGTRQGMLVPVLQKGVFRCVCIYTHECVCVCMCVCAQICAFTCVWV